MTPGGRDRGLFLEEEAVAKGGLQIAGVDIGLQVALVTVRGATGLKKWVTEELGLDADKTFEQLKAEFGGFQAAQLPEYIQFIWGLQK